MFCTYTLNFWYGGKLIVRGELDADAMMKVARARARSLSSIHRPPLAQGVHGGSVLGHGSWPSVGADARRRQGAEARARHAASSVTRVAQARAAAISIFKIIDRKSHCDATVTVGRPPLLPPPAAKKGKRVARAAATFLGVTRPSATQAPIRCSWSAFATSNLRIRRASRRPCCAA